MYDGRCVTAGAHHFLPPALMLRSVSRRPQHRSASRGDARAHARLPVDGAGCGHGGCGRHCCGRRGTVQGALSARCCCGAYGETTSERWQESKRSWCPRSLGTYPTQRAGAASNRHTCATAVPRNAKMVARAEAARARPAAGPRCLDSCAKWPGSTTHPFSRRRSSSKNSGTPSSPPHPQRGCTHRHSPSRGAASAPTTGSSIGLTRHSWGIALDNSGMFDTGTKASKIGSPQYCLDLVLIGLWAGTEKGLSAFDFGMP